MMVKTTIVATKAEQFEVFELDIISTILLCKPNEIIVVSEIGDIDELWDLNEIKENHSNFNYKTYYSVNLITEVGMINNSIKCVIIQDASPLGIFIAKKDLQQFKTIIG